VPDVLALRQLRKGLSTCCTSETLEAATHPPNYGTLLSEKIIILWEFWKGKKMERH
jgi:hypothetical protein